MTTPEAEKRKEDTHAVKPVEPDRGPPAQPVRPLEECEDYEGERSVRAMKRCEECEKLDRFNDACGKVGINDSSSRRASRKDGDEEEMVDELAWKMYEWLIWFGEM